MLMDTPLFDDIESRLRRYAPSASHEKEFHSQLETLLDNKGSQALWDDHYYPGHVTASGFVLSPDMHSVLMIFHNKLQRWLQPGGHLEPEDATLLSAVQREIQEETGIEATELVVDGIFDIDIHEIPERKGKPAHLHYDVRLLLKSHSSNFITTPEAPQVSWVDLGHARNQFEDRSLLRPIYKVWDLFS